MDSKDLFRFAIPDESSLEMAHISWENQPDFGTGFAKAAQDRTTTVRTEPGKKEDGLCSEETSKEQEHMATGMQDQLPEGMRWETSLRDPPRRRAHYLIINSSILVKSLEVESHKSNGRLIPGQNLSLLPHTATNDRHYKGWDNVENVSNA